MKRKLIICHHSKDYRELHDLHRYSGANETEKIVEVQPASLELLQTELEKLKIKVRDPETITIVAAKFHEELVTLPGGKLAWDNLSEESDFFEIIKYYDKDEK
jgi:hypothetical protein